MELKHLFTVEGDKAEIAAMQASCAAVLDRQIEEMAATCNGNANVTGNERWRTAALALLGARRHFRELMSDADRRAQS